MQEADIDRVGAFTYSPVEGARANALAEHVPTELQQERLNAFMDVAQTISARRLKEKIGSLQTMLVDGLQPDPLDASAIIAVARTRGDAPDVDGIVRVRGEVSQVQIGDVITARITAADAYDLEAVIE